MPLLARAYLERVLEPLADRGTLVDAPIYSLAPSGDGHDALWLGDHIACTIDVLDDLPAWLLWHVNRQVCFETTSHVMIHAAVAAHQHRALVLPAPAEAGKTTLVAGLVRAGLGYLTDEAAAVDPASGSIAPYAKSLSIDRGAWPLFPDLRPDVPAQLQPYARRQWHVDPRSIRPDAIVTEPVEPGWIVTPRYDAGAPTTLEPISRGEALKVLVEQAFTLDHWGQAGLDLLADVVRRSACYRLVSGSLDEAVEAVLSVLDQ